MSSPSLPSLVCLALSGAIGFIDVVTGAEMHVNAFPDTKILEVEITAGQERIDPKTHSCRVAIGPKGKKPTKTVELPALSPKGPTIVSVEGVGIPEGDLTVSAAVLDKNGKVAFQQTRDIPDPFHPWWLNDRTGASDNILPPYQPLAVTNDTIRPWGRSYRFGTCLMPVEVQSRGASILAGPVRLKAIVGGHDIAWQGSPLKITEKRPERVVLTGDAQCEAFSLAGTALVEYDGMIRVDLKLTPKGKPQVDELTLEVPFKPEHAEYLYHFPGKWRSVANSGKLPADGFKHAFKPYWWLGDNDRGFCWFCESARNWWPEDREDAITVDRENGRVVLRLHLIKGEKITTPLEYTFGFEATPNKQPEKTVWDYRISHSGGYGIHKKPVAAAGASIQYKAQGNIRGDRGTAEMWIAPPLDSDPASAGAKDHTQVPNVTLFWLDVDPKTNCGLFWCGPPQQLRIWSRVDDKVLTALSTPVKWKKGELHHVAFTWGERLEIYVDGKLVASQVYKGLLPKELKDAVLHIGKSSPPQLVDEIRVSDIARAPDLDKQPYVADEHTLLLDQLDQSITNPFDTEATTRPAVAGGGPGELRGAPQSAPARHGNGVRLRGGREDYYMLDHLADAGVRTLCFHSIGPGWDTRCPRPSVNRICATSSRPVMTKASNSCSMRHPLPLMKPRNGSCITNTSLWHRASGPIAMRKGMWRRPAAGRAGIETCGLLGRHA